jgi:lipid II:glycine glycyltransferase (peptidoglycan interpeptide bridge formation enzyme)
VQRKIHRAEHESLRIEAGKSEELLSDSCRLQTRARARLGLVPQPLSWFRALISEFGDRVTIAVTYQGRMPVASVVTLINSRTTTYEYGCSEPAHNAMGVTCPLTPHTTEYDFTLRGSERGAGACHGAGTRKGR